MPKGPDHTVQNGIEMGLVKGVQKAEVELDEWFEEGEEVGADLREGVEISGDERKAAGKDHFE